jgi:hypothetical protein
MKLFDEILHCPDEQGWTNPNISRTKNIVEIAESFAINFANWYEFTLRQSDNLNDRFTPKELIKMFKKEKKL